MSTAAPEEHAELSSRGDISPSLVRIDAEESVKQADFWASCVSGKQPELDDLGGLPLDAVANDVLTRYFDSSERGLNLVFDSALRDQKGTVPGSFALVFDSSRGDEKDKAQDCLNKDGLYDALSEHLMFFEVMSDRPEEKEKMLNDRSNTQFESICDAVGLPCSRETFAYAVRRLRIGLLMKHYKLHHDEDDIGKVFHIDYDDDFIYTEFKTSWETRVVKHSGKSFNIPCVEAQSPVKSFADYLYTSKMKRKGRVHWSHLHFPSTELSLAVGQVWRLTGPCLGLICELWKAQPQISYNGKSWRKEADGTDGVHDPKEDSRGYSWSYMVVPAVYLDFSSRENLELYRQWFDARQDPNLRHTVDAMPPPVHVACTHMNLAMLWSSIQANTLLTAESEAYYIGKWTTDASHHTKSFFFHALDRITCAGACTKRKKGGDGRGDYEKLSTKDPDDVEACKDKIKEGEKGGKKHQLAGLPVSDELHEALQHDEHDKQGQKATDEGVSCITFEKTCEQVLQVLERQNSMLRLGDHWHLLTRITVNRTHEYLDVVELYDAAVNRLSFLLHDKDTQNKDDLVAKIETVKLELNQLQRLVQPFGDYVVPELCRLAEAFHFEYPLVYHHVQDIQNNFRTFMPKCNSLISRCQNLTNEYDRIAGDKMNNILNILTFITFVITPMQLMTGLYGMNFKIIPELRWDYGYHYFWSLAMSLTLVFALLLVCLKRA